MARRRKQKYDPRQLTFMFDIMADHIDTIRSENAQADRRDEQAGKAAPAQVWAASMNDEPIIRDILAVSDGTLATLLAQEGYYDTQLRKSRCPRFMGKQPAFQLTV